MYFVINCQPQVFDKNGSEGAKSKNQTWPNNGHSNITEVMDSKLVAPPPVAPVARMVKENKLLILCYKCKGWAISKGIVSSG